MKTFILYILGLKDFIFNRKRDKRFSVRFEILKSQQKHEA